MEFSALTVLIVEDKANVRFTIKSMLLEMNITTVQEAKDGEQALEILKEQPNYFSLILCDWNMPGMSGLDFLTKVRQSQPLLPFIMITARADEPSIIAAKDANVTAYIRKPFSSNQLRGKIDYLFKL